MDTLIFPIYKFRPLPNDCWLYSHYGSPVYRYNSNQWIIDDGQPDLAFVCNNMVVSISIPYQKNILWSWATKHWSAYEPLHTSGNPWHYNLREGTTEWGGNWDRDKHPNIIAAKHAMDYACSLARCANGGGPDFHLDDKYILAGLVQITETGEIVVPPKEPSCMYCQHRWLKDPNGGISWLTNINL